MTDAQIAEKQKPMTATEVIARNKEFWDAWHKKEGQALADMYGCMLDDLVLGILKQIAENPEARK